MKAPSSLHQDLTPTRPERLRRMTPEARNTQILIDSMRFLPSAGKNRRSTRFYDRQDFNGNPPI